MKSLDDFCSEVYRRYNEEKELQKKRRKKILMTCIPLVLVFSIFFFYPAFLAAESKDSAIENAIESTATSNLFEITVLQGETITVLEADSNAAKQITSLFFSESHDVSDLTDEADQKPKEENAPQSGTESTPASQSFTFVLTDENGKSLRFVLEEEVLIRLDTGKEKILSDAELNKLHSLLANNS